VTDLFSGMYSMPVGSKIYKKDVICFPFFPLNECLIMSKVMQNFLTESDFLWVPRACTSKSRLCNGIGTDPLVCTEFTNEDTPTTTTCNKTILLCPIDH
jgi:hypothetical protein